MDGVGVFKSDEGLLAAARRAESKLNLAPNVQKQPIPQPKPMRGPTQWERAFNLNRRDLHRKAPEQVSLGFFTLFPRHRRGGQSEDQLEAEQKRVLDATYSCIELIDNGCNQDLLTRVFWKKGLSIDFVEDRLADLKVQDRHEQLAVELPQLPQEVDLTIEELIAEEPSPDPQVENALRWLALTTVLVLSVGLITYYGLSMYGAPHAVTGGHAADMASKPLHLLKPVPNLPVYTHQFGLQNGMWSYHKVF